MTELATTPTPTKNRIQAADLLLKDAVGKSIDLIRDGRDPESLLYVATVSAALLLGEAA